MASQPPDSQVEIGIHAYGAYVPQWRIDRAEIAAAHAWSNPGLASSAVSERSACGYDEDAITMSVEAARDACPESERVAITDLFSGSTTSPFRDRLNAGIVSGGLGLSDDVRAQDTSGSLRAGTSALLSAFDAATARDSVALCVAAERRASPAGTSQELSIGHGAAAVVVGRGKGIARLLGRASLTVDFVDHFRMEGREFDYQWEQRWVRDEGHLKLIPRLVARALAASSLDTKDVDHFCLPLMTQRLRTAVARASGLAETTLAGDLAAGCGDTGAAHALLMLVDTLDGARAGEKVLVVGVGQGGDALVFEVTEEIERRRRARRGLPHWLERRADLPYHRYLALHGLVKIDAGMRAETDRPTAPPAAYRHRDLLLSLRGGRCTTCGTPQIPKSAVCVNPTCGASGTQVPYSFAEAHGTVASWSADRLTFTPDPPAYYGMIDFEGGGRLLMDFADIGAREIAVGMPMRMVFRVKDYDPRRGFTRYFWKAAPTGEGL